VTGAERRLAEARRSHAVAIVILGCTTIAIWWPVLGPGVLWSLPMLALAAVGVMWPRNLLDSRGGGWVGAAAFAWIVFALLLAGVPASALAPGALGGTLHELNPNTRTERPISIVPRGGLSTVMKLLASKLPKNQADQLCEAARAAAE